MASHDDKAVYPPSQDAFGFTAVTVHPSTTPLISPPSSPRDGSPEPAYSDKGNAHYGPPEGESLLGPSVGARERKAKNGSPVDALLKLVLGVLSLLITLTLLSRFGIIHPREHVVTHLAPYIPSSVSNLILPTVSPTAPHPIIPLLEHANDHWGKLVASQSTTFDKATRTYKSRYGAAAPPGFDKWFAFATQGRNHSLVDEYDQLMEDLKPYRSLTPQELRRRTAELAQVPGISIVSIRNGVAQVHSKSGKWAPALAFQQMLQSFVRDLPDMDIAINEKAEGRVLPKQQRRVYMTDYGLEGEELATSAFLLPSIYSSGTLLILFSPQTPPTRWFSLTSRTSLPSGSATASCGRRCVVPARPTPPPAVSSNPSVPRSRTALSSSRVARAPKRTLPRLAASSRRLPSPSLGR